MNRLFLKSPSRIIDYFYLMDLLKNYKKPRSKVTSLLKSGDLVRVKKGLYLIADYAATDESSHYYSKEVLANLIYGPSYVSLEYALSYYGLIPERVEEVTSMTMMRNKHFLTPVGRFSYRYLHLDKYSVGVTFERLGERGGFLIATPEKALADVVARNSNLKNLEEIADYIAGLRIDKSFLVKMDLKKMAEIAKIYRSRQIDLLKNLLEKYYEHHQ